MTLLRFEIGAHAIKKMYEFMQRHYAGGGEWNDDVFGVIIDQADMGKSVIMKGDKSIVFSLFDYGEADEVEWKKTWNDEGVVGKGEAAEYAVRSFGIRGVEKGVQAKYHPSLEEKWEKDEKIKALVGQYEKTISDQQKEIGNLNTGLADEMRDNNELRDKLNKSWGPHHVIAGGGGTASGGDK